MSAGHVQLFLQILEGTNFHLLDHESSLVFKGTLDRVTLSSDPIPLSSINGLRLAIGEEMIWKMSGRNFKRIKTTKALKLECFNVTSTGAHKPIGYIILNLKSVSDSCKNSRGWRRLLGNSMSSNNCPQLLLTFYTKEEKPETEQETLSPEPEIVEILKSVPELTLKSGLSYIGAERFCTKRFQLTCELHTAANLNLLTSKVKSTVRKKQFYLRLLILGQPLSSSSLEFVGSHTDFHQKFVFDVMSSSELLRQYLGEQPSLELELVTGELVLGRCKQYIYGLQPGSQVHLTCVLTDEKQAVPEENQDIPSVELSLSLHALDSKGKCLTLPTTKTSSNKVSTNQEVITPRQRDDEGKANTNYVRTVLEDQQKSHREEGFIPPKASQEVPQLLLESMECLGEPEAQLRTPKESLPLKEVSQEVPQLVLEALDCLTEPEAKLISPLAQPEDKIVSHALLATTAKDTPEITEASGLPSLDHDRPGTTKRLKPDADSKNQAAPLAISGDEDQANKQNLRQVTQKEGQSIGAANMSSPVLSNSEKLVKMVEELEEWKFRQKILFSAELKKEQENLTARWEAAQRVKAEAAERERQAVFERTSQLAEQLERQLRTLQHKSEEVASEEEKFKNLSKILQEKYTKKLEIHQKQNEEARIKIEKLTNRNKQLQQQILILQHDNQRLTNKAQGSETAQLSKLKEKVRELEKRVLQSQHEKAALVRKWVEGQQEAIRAANKSQPTPSGSKRRLQVALEEEKSQLLSERARLEQLRLELDGVGQPPPPAPEPASSSPRSQLRRLQQEREALLLSGVYTAEHELIAALDQAIAGARGQACRND